MAALGQLSAELVHELRQPLFASRAIAQLLSRRVTTDEDASMLDALVAQLDQASTILERYADSGRRPAPLVSPTRLAPPVEAGVALLQRRARQLDKQLSLSVAPREAAVLGDPVGIQQITANLVSNALDAARSAVHVRVTGSEMTVRDDGPGIPRPTQDCIFEPFYTTKPPGEGTGLGLSIVRQLVDASGGQIRCDSSDLGTVFAVRFRDAAAAAG